MPAWLATLLNVVQVVAALGVIVLVLIQHGKGADMGAAFGSGSSGSLFGATGSANFLSRATAALATVFFVATLGLAFAGHQAPQAAKSIMDGAKPAVGSDIPDSRPAAPSDKPAPPSDIPK
jgi:preprotein translocase subunit SecG